MEISTHTMPQPVTALKRGRDENAQRGAGKDRDKRPGELSEEEQRQVEQLKERDREVRAHEAAHMAAAGGHANGGASFSYTKGPDGRNYATGGEVSIDTSPVAGDPQATLQKAQTVQRAAMAPAQPSGQDRQVAAQAAAMAAQARQEIAAERSEEMKSGGEDDGGRTDAAANLLKRIQGDGGMSGPNQSPLHFVV